jgi:hypothetical protein
MPKALYVKGTSRRIMPLTDTQLASLVEHLEEESRTDRDYYVDETVIAHLESRGADAALVAGLRRALGARGNAEEAAASSPDRPEEGIDVEWRED